MAVGRVAGRTPTVPAARRRPGGRLRTGGRAAGRGPFAALVVLILAGGLIALLMLNTALNQGSFQLSQLQQRTTGLTDERQGLQQQIGAWSAPDALSARAQQLGMVPGGSPAFLRDNGAVLGDPKPLDGPPTPSAPPPPTTPAKPTPTGTATPSGTATPANATTATVTPTATPTAHAGTNAAGAAGTTAHARPGTAVKPGTSAHAAPAGLPRAAERVAATAGPGPATEPAAASNGH